MTDLIHEEITEEIIGAAFEVHRVLGYGFLEKVYENALLAEIARRGLIVEAQKTIKVLYKGVIVGDYIADLVVSEKVIVELKAEEQLNEHHVAQLINYLKATGLKVGMLINFGPTKCTFKRIVV